MIHALYGAVESGLIYAIMALGVYISFRILDFPDLTVDGSFVTGGAVAAVMIVGGTNPVIATLAGAIAGLLAGCVTGLLHTKGNINPLLAGILMMIALYSVNLRIMGQPNIPMLNETTLFSVLSSWWQSLHLDAIFIAPFEWIGITDFAPDTFYIIVSMIVIALIVKKLLDFFLRTEAGITLRATGDNQSMVKSFSTNTNLYIVAGMGISNALVGLSGALVVQHNGFADVNLGVGMIIIGLASVIIGEVLFGKDKIVRMTLAVILGSIVYRVIYSLALRVDFLEASDMKLITAIIVIAALVVPNMLEKSKAKRQFKKSKQAALKRKEKGEVQHASTE
ncbi:ABC transporter permease [Tenuibacillus multivorans]|uniref:Putative ABC transport system permease protein n=1 Tax=Tenuibacillus multivorans TaxID=237069 RepID=A0A1H0A2J0_9BACI|nr:ABC transporter permease [Tenuibacillus multivorans]GEL78369.1 ABC transporter permease [Tenuibacillus multivorans]SDN27768.1 putative ABC transport system permease protein [Tenuibacillus multivorans]